MDDNIARVDQHPVAKGHSFDPGIANACFFQLFHESIGDRAHMALRAARGDDHGIAKRRLAGQVDADDVVSLGVLKRVDDEMSEGGGGRSGALCAARIEFGELLIQRVMPQRGNPSFE